MTVYIFKIIAYKNLKWKQCYSRIGKLLHQYEYYFWVSCVPWFKNGDGSQTFIYQIMASSLDESNYIYHTAQHLQAM